MILRRYSLNPEGSPSHWASSFLLLSKVAAKQCSIGNMSPASNKECLQGHRLVRKDEEEEKETENKAKDGSEGSEGCLYIYNISKIESRPREMQVAN